jgi:hypothetical protein
MSTQPFEPRTTENIERANRLLSFRDSPAYNEVFRICQQLIEEARANQRNFHGWDSQQIVALAIRVQVAEEFHEQLFARMGEFITTGIMEAKGHLGALEQSDALRERVLSRAAEYDSRVPGSH